MVPTSHPTTSLRSNVLSPRSKGNVVIRNPDKYRLAYFQAFWIALVLCWSPFKLLAYLAPWVVLTWFLVVSRSQTTLRNLTIVLVLWFATLPLYALLTPGFEWHSAALTLLTYGSIVVIVAIPSRFVASHELSESILALCRWTVLIEGCWGIAQGLRAALSTGTFSGATGDAVAGTIRPFAFSPDLSNPMFAINMVLLLLVLLPSLIQEGRGKVAFAIGLLSLILASVMHVLIFFATAIAVAFIIYYPSFFLRGRRGCLSLLVASTASFIALTLLSSNFATLRNFLQYTLEGRTPRSQVIVRSVTVMPEEYPWMPLIGLGPGQFSSRAALIGTGMYFGSPANPKPLPLLPEGMSTPFQEYLLDLWLSLFFDRSGNYVHTMDNTSSTFVPFFSWLSIFSEFGLLGLVVLLAMVIYILWRIKMRIRGPSRRLTATFLGTGIIFLFLIGLQENYWEVPQAVLVGALLLKFVYANYLYSYSTVAPQGKA